MRWAVAIDGWTDWMVAAGFSAKTVELRRYQLRCLAEAGPRRSPWRVTTADLTAWMAAHDWERETRKSYRSALRSFYQWAVRSGHTRRDPTKDLPIVRVAPTAPRPTPDGVLDDALLGATDRDRLILMLAAYAGLRRGEIAQLRWHDIADDHMVIRGKGGRSRVVPLRDELGKELALEVIRRHGGGRGSGFRYAAGMDGGYVFPGRSTGHMTPDAVGKAAIRALRGWGAHTLRHRFATRAYAAERDLLAVQALLGHSKPETTRRYTSLADGALARAVDAV